MINKTILVGRLTRDPELRKTGTGKSVINFTVACNRQFGDRDEADFINCVVWNHTADFMVNYLNKGALVGLEGRIQTGSSEDRETGKMVYTTDVVVDNLQALESKKDRVRTNEQSRYEERYEEPKPRYSAPEEAKEPPLDITSDDLPF